MLAITAPQPQIITNHHSQVDPLAWLNYFDPQAALDEVVNHVETLPGSRNERHTMRAYLASLADCCAYLGATILRRADEDYTFDFSGMHMPTKPAIGDYIAYCKRRGLTSSTITRYMAAVRHFIRALEEQPVYPRSGNDFVFILECQRQFRLAAGVKNPAADRTSNRPALEQHGQRLTLAQVNRLFESFAAVIGTLAGKRDLALLYLGITSGLRAAELARLTLGSITPGSDCYEVKVRGKRANHDPIGIDSIAYALIMAYVDCWNDRLDGSDPRRITTTTRIFQPVLYGDSIPPLGHKGFTPEKGITPRAILEIVARRTEHALGKAITAHDMRRTCAHLMRSNGFEWDHIRAQLRHQSIGTTEKYVGQQLDLSRALLSKRVTFIIPSQIGGAD